MLVLWQCIIFYWVQWSSPYPCHVNALKYFILICIFLSWILIVLLPTPFECSDSLCSFLWSLTDLRTLFHFLLHSIWLDCYNRLSWKTAWFIEVNCSLKKKKHLKGSVDRDTVTPVWNPGISWEGEAGGWQVWNQPSSSMNPFLKKHQKHPQL